MKTNTKILVTSAGSINAINVIRALRGQNEVKISIIAADTNYLAAGFFLADKFYQVPNAKEPNFIKSVLAICKKERISIIIPTFSKELPVFAQNKAIFEKKGIKMAISPYETYLLTENKTKTNELFDKWGIPYPKVFTDEDVEKRRINFPAIIKPVEASGSRGVTKVNNWEELLFFKSYIKDSFIQEFAEGEEYTIDGVCDLNGKMIGASPRIRMELKEGLAVKSFNVKNDKLVRYAKIISEGFGVVGPFNVQCIKNGKVIKFIEINSRFPSGGLPLTVGAGLNIPLILVKMLLGIKILKPSIKYNLFMTRFWDAIVLKKDKNKYAPL